MMVGWWFADTYCHFWSFLLSLTLILMLKSYGVVGGWLVGWMHLDYNVSSVPFLTMNFEFDRGHGPRLG